MTLMSFFCRMLNGKCQETREPDRRVLSKDATKDCLTAAFAQHHAAQSPSGHDRWYGLGRDLLAALILLATQALRCPLSGVKQT